jgi:hypothetical protein
VKNSTFPLQIRNLESRNHIEVRLYGVLNYQNILNLNKYTDVCPTVYFCVLQPLLFNISFRALGSRVE